MIKLELIIGKQKLTCEANDMKVIHRFSAIYGALPKKCDACGSQNIFLSHKSPGGNDYYTLSCTDCNAELAIHEKKENKGFYIKRDDKMQVYIPKNKSPKNIIDTKAEFDGSVIPDDNEATNGEDVGF